MSALAAELAYPQVRWDLTALFTGIDDPQIESTWQDVVRRADEFAAKYRDKVADLDADALLRSIRELEELVTQLTKPITFANLLFAADASSAEVGAFLQAQMERASTVRVKVLFFELELQKLSDERIEVLLRDPALEYYRHYIETTRAYTPHMLSEIEEVLLEETANTGSRAWERLFEEVTSNHEYQFSPPDGGETQILSQEELLVKLRDANRSVRAAAGAAFTDGLRKQSRVLTFIYNTLLQDKRTLDRRRQHPYPEHSRHLSNELDAETVDLVVDLCAEYSHLVARYYYVKRDILGLPELTHIDRYAPLFEAEEQVDYERAQKIVFEAFQTFAPEMANRANDFFKGNWIDAEPRSGKTGGAFCSYATPDTHPFILMSYTNRMRDVAVLAHELGHGVHASLSREQSAFNFHGTLPLAELASIFGEMLVFESLIAQASLKDKVALYARKIEDMFASVFRQASMYRFEKRAHRARAEQGELSTQELGEIWHAELQNMFGDSVILGEDHKIWWLYIGHFFEVPFYVYAYAFGELLAMSVYKRSKESGADFAEQYLALLRLGGSKSPQDLMSTIGVDLTSREFWLGGIAEMQALIEQFEAYWQELRTSGAL